MLGCAYRANPHNRVNQIYRTQFVVVAVVSEVGNPLLSVVVTCFSDVTEDTLPILFCPASMVQALPISKKC